ncbi:hypothetical protein GCM10022249_17370 [Enteractinococcus coprophilus]
MKLRLAKLRRPAGTVCRAGLLFMLNQRVKTYARRCGIIESSSDLGCDRGVGVSTGGWGLSR